MTEAEAFEITLLASANGITAFTVYVTVTFGYLIAAFFVGERLSRAQTAIVNALYCLASISALLVLLSSMNYMDSAAVHAPSLMPKSAISQPSFWRIYMTPVMIAGIFASLYFMTSLRKSRSE